ncbi:MAG: glycosyltransferase family 4 protein [Bacteroidota bacterium]|nr:glycosyltransferase family 4 protein [Bacteroidota bacterium]
MKIAQIIPSLLQFGPVIVANDLSKLLVERGHEVTVFYFDEKPGNLLTFPCKTQQIKMSEKIDFNAFDVVHCHGIRPDIYVWKYRKKSDKAKFVSTIHAFLYEDIKSTYNPLIAKMVTPIWLRILRKPDVRVVLSKQALKYYEKAFKGLKTVCVYNSRITDRSITPTEEEKEELLKFKGDKVLLGVNAGLTPRKAVDVIINALPLLEECKLFIAGDGKVRQELEQLAKDSGVTERVHFAGYRRDAFKYIPYYDIYMMPSRAEGFPLALLEAMSMKCNAVVSDIPIFKEFFTNEEVTFFKLDDWQDCAKAVKYAINHNKGEQAYNKYMSDYSPEIFVENYLKVYRGEI